MADAERSSEDTRPSSQATHDPLIKDGATSKPSASSKLSAAVSNAAEKAIETLQSAVPRGMNPDEVSKLSITEQEADNPKPSAGYARLGKKEKKAKTPKPQPVAPPSNPLSPALLDLRVGEILLCEEHGNAESLYVSTIAMGDSEGTENTHKDEKSGKIVRTVCSGLRGLVPIEQMQGRKVITVANLKPVTMRGIKSAAMILAASPKPSDVPADEPKQGNEHSHDRLVELVNPPPGAQAGEKAYFEGWPYGEGKGPEKQLNPKKKQWEAIQPGFFTTEGLEVAFDSSNAQGMDKGGGVGNGGRGNLIVESGGVCTVTSLKGAIVR